MEGKDQGTSPPEEIPDLEATMPPPKKQRVECDQKDEEKIESEDYPPPAESEVFREITRGIPKAMRSILRILLNDLPRDVFVHYQSMVLVKIYKAVELILGVSSDTARRIVLKLCHEDKVQMLLYLMFIFEILITLLCR